MNSTGKIVNEEFEKVLERVRKLMAKAEGTDSPEEADAFLAKSNELMVRYAIEEHLLRSTSTVKEDPVVISIHVKNPYARDKISLLDILAISRNCRLGTWSRTRDGGTAKVVGFPSDLEFLQMLFESVRGQMITEMWKAVEKKHYRETLQAFKSSFFLGFNSGVKNVLQKSEKVEVDREPGTSLVLADRKDEVERASEDKFGKPRYVTRNFSGTGFSHGKSAGSRAELGLSNRLGGRQKELSR